MNKTVNRRIIDNWTDENKPNGMAKLAIKAGVSSSMLEKLRLGEIPAKEQNRLRICRALEVQEDELFVPSENLKSS